MGHRVNFAVPAGGLQEGFPILHSLVTPLPVLRSHLTPTEACIHRENGRSDNRCRRGDRLDRGDDFYVECPE